MKAKGDRDDAPARALARMAARALRCSATIGVEFMQRGSTGSPSAVPRRCCWSAPRARHHSSRDCCALSRTLPRARTLILEGQGHGAIDGMPERFAEAACKFSGRDRDPLDRLLTRIAVLKVHGASILPNLSHPSRRPNKVAGSRRHRGRGPHQPLLCLREEIRQVSAAAEASPMIPGNAISGARVRAAAAHLMRKDAPGRVRLARVLQCPVDCPGREMAGIKRHHDADREDRVDEAPAASPVTKTPGQQPSR